MLGHIAGTAASIQGFISMLGAATIGFFIGQNFNGTLESVDIHLVQMNALTRHRMDRYALGVWS